MVSLSGVLLCQVIDNLSKGRGLKRQVMEMASTEMEGNENGKVNNVG